MITEGWQKAVAPHSDCWVRAFSFTGKAVHCNGGSHQEEGGEIVDLDMMGKGQLGMRSVLGRQGHMSRGDGKRRGHPRLGKRKLDALAMQLGDWEFYANGFRRPGRVPGAVEARANWVDGGTLSRRVLMDRRSISRAFFFPG